mmetsp:Transcript_108249/g.334309  ORF Transcript_108249/g.334309 Transcript_108249/m.334309 type:complete len:214 (+) Transcript_108249:2-643(+)
MRPPRARPRLWEALGAMREPPPSRRPVPLAAAAVAVAALRAARGAVPAEVCLASPARTRRLLARPQGRQARGGACGLCTAAARKRALPATDADKIARVEAYLQRVGGGPVQVSALKKAVPGLPVAILEPHFDVSGRQVRSYAAMDRQAANVAAYLRARGAPEVPRHREVAGARRVLPGRRRRGPCRAGSGGPRREAPRRQCPLPEQQGAVRRC